LRLQYPTQPLRFIVDYDEYNNTTNQREQGQMRVTYYSPKMEHGSSTLVMKHEVKLTCNGKKLVNFE
jgi:hypothetical protein